MRGISALALCALWAAVGLGAPGCAPSTARLTVRVQSGLRAGDELRHVRAFVFRGGSCVDAVEIGAGALPLERDEQSALGAGTLTVAEVGPLEPGVYAVQLVGRRPGATGAESGAVLLERCVVTSISNDRVLRIALTTACVGVTCPAAGGSEAFTECLNGQCVDPRCDPTRPETEAFCCDRDRLGDACDADPSVCRDDDDCDVIADCVGAPRCSEGACIEAEDDRCDEAGAALRRGDAGVRARRSACGRGRGAAGCARRDARRGRGRARCAAGHGRRERASGRRDRRRRGSGSRCRDRRRPPGRSAATHRRGTDGTVRGRARDHRVSGGGRPV